jgi:pimeloyl-ACP methyl ester carboxylesterase
VRIDRPGGDVMTAEASAPRRTTHTWGPPHRLSVHDRWGAGGRPLLLLHGLLFDRTMWWPVAAELATERTIIAVDLPGHGESPPRTEYRLPDMVEELAGLMHSLNLRRAPIVVGHTTSCELATRFADRIATHALVTVDPMTLGSGDGARPGPRSGRELVAAMRLDHVPSMLQSFATPRRDTALFDAYRRGYEGNAASVPARVAPGHEPLRVSIVSGGGTPANDHTIVYPAVARLPHLTDVRRFADDLRALS